MVFAIEPLGPFKFESRPYTLAFAPIEIPEAERKLVAWWKLDETEGGEVSDSSGNNHVGTLAGDPRWQPTGGKIGGALEFDGIDDYVDYVDYWSDVSLNITKALTVAAWIKLSGPAEDQKIVSNQDNVAGGYKFGVYANKVELEIRDSGNAATMNRDVDGGTDLQPGVWYHVTGVYSQGNYIRTYVNGELDRELVTEALLAPTSGTLKIGREPFMDAYFYKGLIDELRIFNYALSEAEVAAIYAGKELGRGRNWIPVLVIVVIAVVAAGLATRRKKATT